MQKQTIHFNTGRKYSAHGQRISATHHGECIVTFYDHDRMIFGAFDFVPDVETFDAKLVMAYYDSGSHNHTMQAYEDGMMPGGCNSKWEGK